MRKSSAVPAGQCRAPARVVGQVRLRVALQQADDDLGDDAAADGSEVEAVLDQLRFLQHVVPERRRVLEAVAEPLELVEVGGAEGCDAASRRARAWPDGSAQVTWRSRLRSGSAVGPECAAMAPIGRWKSGVEIFVSIRLLCLTWPSPKSKNVCQPMKRRGAPEAAAQVVRIGRRCTRAGRR